MCIAELNRATAACQHTYFRLNRPCSAGANLANCGKLSLSGWENRTDRCAFCCQAAALDQANYRLLGWDDAAGPLSRTNSLSTMTTASQASARRDSRRGSLARSDSSTGSSAYGYGMTANPGTAAYAMTPLTQYASERNIYRNQRIDSYLAQLPETVSRAGKQSGYEAEGTSGRSRAGSTSSGGTGASSYAAADGSSSKRWSVKGRKLSKIF